MLIRQRSSRRRPHAEPKKGAFWFQTYAGALTGELFAELLQKLMYRRRKGVHLVVDGLPAHKKGVVKKYVAETNGRLTLHFLPGYAPDLPVSSARFLATHLPPTLLTPE